MKRDMEALSPSVSPKRSHFEDLMSDYLTKFHENKAIQANKRIKKENKEKA
jgi:hypothetical protein